MNSEFESRGMVLVGDEQPDLVTRNRERKQCAFCENKADSNEHFWPDWLGQIFPGGNQYSTTHTASFGEHIKYQKKISNLPHRISRRILCVKRNNEWGSGIVEDAKPALLKCISFEIIQLTSDEINKLLKWIVMFCFIVEFDFLDIMIFKQETRDRFRKKGVFPDEIEVSISLYNGQAFLLNSQRNTLFAGYELSDGSREITVGYETITFCLGGVLFHALCKESYGGPHPEDLDFSCNVKRLSLHPVVDLGQLVGKGIDDDDAHRLSWRVLRDGGMKHAHRLE